MMNEKRLCTLETMIKNSKNAHTIADDRVLELISALRAERLKVAELQEEMDRLTTLRPIEELQTESDVLLWIVPITEPPIVGSRNDDHFDSYYQTHWSPLPRVKDIIDEP